MKIKANFGKAVDKYSKFRPEYPTELYNEIFSWIENDDYKIAMDVGAGTGLSTLPLIDIFDQIIAVEPDYDMFVSLTKKLANEKVTVENKFLDDIDYLDKEIDLITFGTSFYWTQGEKTIKKIQSLLKDNGVLAVYRYDFPTVPDEIKEIIEFESNVHWDDFRHERLRDTDYSNRIVRNSNLFSLVETKLINNVIDLSIEQIVGFFTSTSYGSAYLRSISNPKMYIDTLTNELKNNTANNVLPVDFQLELILAR